MPIEKYVRDSIVQKHISFPFPTRFKIAEALAGFKRRIPPLAASRTNCPEAIRRRGAAC